MNRKEHITACIGEEGAEISKEVSKALRFGLLDKVTVDPLGERGTEGPTVSQKITNELIDLLAVYQMAVREEGMVADIGLHKLPKRVWNLMEKKIKKVENYMLYAKKVGSLDE